MHASKLGGLKTAKRPAPFAVGRDNLLQLTETLLDPLVLAFSIWGINFYFEGEVGIPAFILSLLVFSIAFPGRNRLRESVWSSIVDILGSYTLMAALVLFFGYATHSLEHFSSESIIHWLWVAPLAQIGTHLLFRATAPRLLQWQGGRRRAVIVGMNDQGMALAKRLPSSPYNDIELMGYFDDRTAERLHAEHTNWRHLGTLAELGAYCKEHRTELIYLSLPMATQPRILSLLDDLRDTTASIYFIPDTFVTDLIQGRMSQICDVPIVSVCETPFTGSNGLIKRGSDIVLSLCILALISPLLLAIALGVKFTSPGPVIFRQRRYGLNGEEIVVYKFRSMSVCEDGGTIHQARKGDQRITPLGALLRKTSMDELPQFINVLQGRMSIVGPRPHAVAHNELYRKLIKGYMVRHKVKPGITGWAQVNGLRGETETLDKMQARIEYDLDYLRHWSLGLDLKIILMTVGVVFKDQYAY